ncbi:hypothetical protein LINPERPRIM_LOCUS17544 [Linum perenne]
MTTMIKTSFSTKCWGSEEPRTRRLRKLVGLPAEGQWRR